MLHTLAFYTNDLAQNTVLGSLGTVTDQIFASPNGRYQIPTDAKVVAAYAGVPDGSQALLNAPIFNRMFYPQIDPISLTALPANVPPIRMFGDSGPQLMATEELVVQVSRAGAGVADSYAAVWVQDRPTPTPGGQIFTLRATATAAVAEGIWSSGNLTFQNALPAGRYAVVGMSAYGTNLLLARLIFQGSVWRPGVLAQGAIGEWNMDEFRFGNMGVFGTFDSYSQPSCDFFSVGACTAETVYLDLIKIA